MKATCAKPASPLAGNAFSQNQSGKLGLYHKSPFKHNLIKLSPPPPQGSWFVVRDSWLVVINSDLWGSRYRSAEWCVLRI